MKFSHTLCIAALGLLAAPPMALADKPVGIVCVFNYTLYKRDPDLMPVHLQLDYEHATVRNADSGKVFENAHINSRAISFSAVQKDGTTLQYSIDRSDGFIQYLILDNGAELSKYTGTCERDEPQKF